MPDIKKVHIQYFAILREQRGLNEETVSTAAQTGTELYRELQGRHRFSLPRGRLKFSLNDEFADWTAPLKTGDRIAFIPPVAGG